MKSKVIEVIDGNEICHEPYECKYSDTFDRCNYPYSKLSKNGGCPYSKVIKLVDLEFALKKFEDLYEKLLASQKFELSQSWSLHESHTYYIHAYEGILKDFKKLRRELGLGEKHE